MDIVKINKARVLIRPGGALVHFICLNQRTVLNELLGGEECDWYATKLVTLATYIDSIPRTYDTDNVPTPDKMLHLHYFTPGSDTWIIELDLSAPTSGGQHHQAFGMRAFTGDHGEIGYISIPEMLDNHAELDLHFEPRKLRNKRS